MLTVVLAAPGARNSQTAGGKSKSAESTLAGSEEVRPWPGARTPRLLFASPSTKAIISCECPHC